MRRKCFWNSTVVRAVLFLLAFSVTRNLARAATERCTHGDVELSTITIPERTSTPHSMLSTQSRSPAAWQSQMDTNCGHGHQPGDRWIRFTSTSHPRRLATGLMAWGLIGCMLISAAVPTIDLQMSTGAIEQLESKKVSNETVAASLTTEGTTNIPVKVRNRGRWSRSWDKTPLKVFVPTNAIPGRSCFNLNSTYRDPSWIRERLAFHIYELAGVPASHTRFVEVRFNSNIVFCDGHVEAMRTNHLFATTDPVTRRWNLDNQPHPNSWKF